MARCTTYTSTDIEQLGFLLNRDPYNSQTEVLKLYLNKFSQAAVVKLINHPIRRYSGQTSVHLAATNGLWECLEILLIYGGLLTCLSITSCGTLLCIDTQAMKGFRTSPHHVQLNAYYSCFTVLEKFFYYNLVWRSF